MALVELFKKEIRERKLAVDIRAQRAGCIDVCANGPALVVYPEGVFYGKVEPADVAEIVESHLVNDIAVERLKLKV